jgi:hypothetical protein
MAVGVLALVIKVALTDLNLLDLQLGLRQFLDRLVKIVYPGLYFQAESDIAPPPVEVKVGTRLNVGIILPPEEILADRGIAGITEREITADVKRQWLPIIEFQQVSLPS